MKIITNRGCSYFVEDLTTVELGSMIIDTEENKMYILLEPNTLTEIDATAIPVETLEALTEAIAAGGNIAIEANIDAPTGFVITADTTVINNGELSISEDTVGDGVFKVTNSTLTLDGKGVINGLDKSGWSMAIWATENGKVVIKDGYFTNVGAHSETDSEHYDLIYASGNAQIEILGGEFKCETPKWTLNIKDKDRATANIVVKGGKFHGFNPATSDIEGSDFCFLAPGYKVVEESADVFVVMPE
jgi:hypothetical protein